MRDGNAKEKGQSNLLATLITQGTGQCPKVAKHQMLRTNRMKGAQGGRTHGGTCNSKRRGYTEAPKRTSRYEGND
ncbi:hypothetical protein LIER_13233 [Lithospermum erythrorhizon]|uniref:Uncharacterized protein n=1 Tax=Lithospermum erythrorhizon TaxID=34254 RepID=A0AAV3PUQ0_LITER